MLHVTKSIFVSGNEVVNDVEMELNFVTLLCKIAEIVGVVVGETPDR